METSSVAEGHEVVGLSATVLRSRVEAIGATFRPFPGAADVDWRDMAGAFPEFKALPPGPAMTTFYLERVFADPIRAQHDGLREVLRDFPADVVIADNLFLGVLPMLLGPRSERPPIVTSGTTILTWHLADGAPHGAGMPVGDEAAHRKRADLAAQIDGAIYEPFGRTLDALLARDFGVGPMPATLPDAIVLLPDRHLQLTVPEFEYPRPDLPASARFIGALPIAPDQAPLPPWAADLDGSRKVVLVTQGTLSNLDFGLLVAPALAALADEPDLLVVVTAGGRPVDAIPGAIPANARVASYLPFDWLLPKVDAFVTNGGYGSVNQALSFGIPIVTAGLTEDKASVSARVAWSGVGIDLATNEPAPDALRAAVRSVLGQAPYRRRARRVADAFAKVDARSEILAPLDELVGARP